MVQQKHKTKQQLIEDIEELVEHNRQLEQKISERGQADDLLQFVQSTMEHAADAVYWVKSDGHIFYVNQAAQDLLGYTREELLAMQISTINPQCAGDNWNEHWRELHQKKFHIFESTNRTKAGLDITVEITATYVCYAGEEYCCSLARDLSEKKRIEESLLFERHLMQTLLDYIPDIIYFKDRDDRFVRVSHSLEQLTHTASGGLVGKTDFDIVDQFHAEQKHADNLEVINSAKRIIDKEESSAIFGHDDRWVSTTKLPWYDERGNIIGLFGISRDITQRKAAETARDLKDDLLNRSQKISQIILSKLDSNHIIEALAEQIILGGIFRSLMIALVDEESLMVNVVGSFMNEAIAPNKDGLGDPNNTLRSYTNTNGLQYRLDDDNITAVTARTGTIQIIEEWDQRLDSKVNTLEERRGKVAYFIPIKQGKRVIAVLGTGSQVEEKERTLQKIDTMAPLWDQVAIALDHARLYEILQQQITKREHIEKSLRESEGRFRDLYRDAPVAYFSVQPNGHIRQVNEQAATLLGSSQDDLIGTPVIDLYADTPSGKEKAQRTLQRFTKGEIIRNEELQMQHRDGRVIWVSLTVTPVRDEHGKVIESRSVAIDITDHQRMEEELRRVHNLESLGVLAGGIAHDFNNVLTGVIGSLALLERLAEAGSEMQAIAQEGRQPADRTRDLTQQLLTFAKGGAPVRGLAIIEDLLRETVEMSLHGSNTKAHYDLADNLYSVEVDKGQIGQVIQNLVLNADQAMPEGGIISIAAKNEEIKAGDTRPLVPGNYVVVRIEDQGCGIPPSQLERIFDPYFTTKKAGHGLGLSIVHSVVLRHGGYIQVHSQIDAGSTFEFHLPASLAPATERVKKERVLPHGSGRILMMDDEELIHNSVGKMLKVIGYEVYSVYDGTEAIAAYRESLERGTPYDVVIVDLTIPGGMGGKETLAQLLSIDAETQVIVSSGYANDPVLANFSEFGFAGKIAKPVDMQELAETLEGLLARDK